MPGCERLIARPHALLIPLRGWPAARKLLLADAAEVAVEAMTTLGRDDDIVVKELLRPSRH